MAHIPISEALSAYERFAKRQAVTKSADSILLSEARDFSSAKTYDIFLSHAYEDAKIIKGVKVLLEENGYTVYVDWLEDEKLDRSRVTPATAALLRERMRSSKSLLFATSKASPDSKWMPWELGYYDGLRPGKVSILPLLAPNQTTFQGQEYLGLYPTVERLRTSTGKDLLAVTRGRPLVESSQYAWLRDFTQGQPEFRTF